MTIVRTAIVQAAAMPLSVDSGIAAAVDHIEKAAAQGARLIAFGETFLGGYPIWLDEAPGAALWDHPGTKALHAILLKQALVDNDPRLGSLQQAVDRLGVIVSIGAHFRKRASLYNDQLLLRPDAAPLHHLKLVPTHGERLIWGRGDGSTLDVHEAPFGAVGSLICWEHWMPLARAAMHHAGEVFHIAAWPTVRETYAIASRHYAFEGRCFVLAAGTVMHRSDLFDGLAAVGGDGAAHELFSAIPDGQLQFGGSMIVAPDASVLAAAGAQSELVIADCDTAKRDTALAALDTDGHYARPDVFELSIDRRPRDGVVTR
jgi:predicted amidohydrolase